MKTSPYIDLVSQHLQRVKEEGPFQKKLIDGSPHINLKHQALWRPDFDRWTEDDWARSDKETKHLNRRYKFNEILELVEGALLLGVWLLFLLALEQCTHPFT